MFASNLLISLSGLGHSITPCQMKMNNKYCHFHAKDAYYLISASPKLKPCDKSGMLIIGNKNPNLDLV